MILAAATVIFTFATRASAQSAVSSKRYQETSPRVILVARHPMIYERGLTPNLRLSASADSDVGGRIQGWQIAVRRGIERRNLLYHDRSHGAHPSQFDAWSTLGYWPPGPRELSVIGYPLVVVARCSRCRCQQRCEFRVLKRPTCNQLAQNAAAGWTLEIAARNTLLKEILG